MYPKEQKIPTVIALIILLFGLGGGIFLLETSKNPQTKASSTLTPNNIKTTNITESAFSVSWTTSDKTTGTLAFGESPNLGYNALDDRDEDGKPKIYENHHITIRNLKENSKYYFKVISGNKTFDNGGDPYTVFTGAKIKTPLQIDPAYGVILDGDGKFAEGVIVYLTVANSIPLSTLTKSSGTWLIPLTNLRNSDLSTRPNITDRERIEILVKGNRGQTITAVTDTKNDSPVPTMTLGKTYDFQNLQTKKSDSLAQKPRETSVLGISDTKNTNTNQANDTAYKKIDFVFPYKNGTPILDTKPLFKGLGIPNKEVIITVNSAPQIGKTLISPDGTWSWSVPQKLNPGDHTVSFTTTDENGNPVTLTRAFYIMKSGTQVLGDATPSATIYPTETPATPSATPKPPVTGNVEPTYIMIGLGLFFTVIGLKFLLFP